MASVYFTLRKWKAEDTKSLSEYANNKKIADKLRNVFPHPYTLKDAEEYINACILADESKEYCRGIDIEGKAVGSIGIFLRDDVYCKSGELGYWLAEPFWGKGIMTEAIKQICEIVFEKYDIVRIFAEPYANNMESRRVLEKAGFQLEGILRKSVYKNGQLMDSCMYSLIKDTNI
ncbi:MAG TPA: GNAT family protein [Defluviitaleaceae bacterium]|nr:GNAT family protein [Defluviitaleaceae bacterium]